jgi:hypothetical protein
VRRALPLVAAATVLAASAVVATPAQAASSTSGAAITAIYFDSPGSDTGRNSSLVGEWASIRNTTRTTRTLTHWTLRDKSNHVFTFPTFTLRAGATVKVHSGKGTKSSTNLYYNKAWYVWNNTGDTAYLRNASGKTIHTCGYTKASAPRKTC